MTDHVAINIDNIMKRILKILLEYGAHFIVLGKG